MKVGGTSEPKAKEFHISFAEIAAMALPQGIMIYEGLPRNPRAPGDPVAGCLARGVRTAAVIPARRTCPRSTGTST
jgi:hypothetical protein